MHESSLRDQLSKQLPLLEPGLQLLATEYHLPNAEGTHGFIDILAKDRHGVVVVIEVKRSHKETGKAVQQVLKYVELLGREIEVPSRSLRAMIVSTEWDDLLAPLSNQARDWPYDLRGYQLLLDEEGAHLIGAKPIEPLPPPIDHGLTRAQHLFCFRTFSDRDLGWAELLRRGNEVGADNLVGVLFDSTIPQEMPGPYMIYLALGRLDPADPRTEFLASYEDLVSEDDYEDYETCLQNQALVHLLRDIGETGTQEIGYPEKFDDLLKPSSSWRLGEVRRAGVFARQQVLFNDEELLDELRGVKGLSQFQFSGSARPVHKAGWQGLLLRAQASLAGNDKWRTLLLRWLSEIADELPESDVSLSIFNPCDLLGSLVGGWPADLGDYMPRMLAVASEDSQPRRRLLGTLAWEGEPIPDLLQFFKLVYRDPVAWYVWQSTGETWQSDLELLELLGLQYVVIEIDDVGRWFLLACEDGEERLRRIPATKAPDGNLSWEGRSSLTDFIQAHAGQLDTLTSYYRASSFG